jgi:hypothetical protein
VSVRAALAVACAAAVGGVLLAATTASAMKQTLPRTLATTSAAIRTFAQAGGRIAWVGDNWGVRVQTLSTGRTWLAGSARPFGRQAKQGIPPQLALSGTRVAWTVSGGGDSLETDLYARTPGERKARLVGGDQADPFVGVGDGGYFGTMAASGPTLAFSSLFYRCADESCAQLAVPTGLEAHFNATFRLVGVTKRAAVRGAPGAFELAVSGRRLAALPAASPMPTGSRPYAVAGATVDVRDADTGALVTQFTPPGVVRALALSPTVAAVVDASPGGVRTIARYDANSGALLGTTDVAAGDSLALSGRTVVFAVGRKIESLDAVTGQVQLLATSPGAPIGLSVSGKRLAWAVNVRGGGRVLALTLP